MTQLTTRSGLRILLLDADPERAALLKHLLQLVPGIHCSADVHQPVFELVPEDCSAYDLCFLSIDYAPGDFVDLVSRVSAGGSGPRLICLQSEDDLSGDRQETARAVRAGVTEFLSRDELSVRLLRRLLNDLPLQSSPALGRAVDVETGQETVPGTTPSNDDDSGSWSMDLHRQHAWFDPQTLARLGYGEGNIGRTLGDWKSLIHPDDVDRLLRELNQVLEGNAAPHPVNYRILDATQQWRQVVSDDFNVQLDNQGNPARIQGTFYPAEAYPTANDAAPDAPTEPVSPLRGEAFDASAIAKLLFRFDENRNTFVLIDANTAAGIARDDHALVGATAGEIGLQVDGAALDDVLRRVGDNGINEAHRVLLRDGGGQPRWRDYEFARINEHTVLAEYADVTAAVDEIEQHRLDQAFWKQVVNSLPDVALILDEDGDISQLVAGDLRDLNYGTTPESLEELLGVSGATSCRSEITRTLNTGKRTHFSCQVGDGETAHWLECRLSPLQTAPGMSRKVICTAHDISERVRSTADLRSTRELYREALHRMPVVVYLKDTDGRYLLVNPHFEAMFGIEEEAILGKTDYEVFADDLATELYVTDHKVLDTMEPLDQEQLVGSGESRRRFRQFSFPVCTTSGQLSGVCTLAIPLDRSNSASANGGAGDEFERDITAAAAAIISRVERALTEADDYSGILAQLEQLVDTTMQAQALLHQFAGEEQASGGAIHAAPLARDVLELEEILLPPGTVLESDLADDLPPLNSEPLAFQQLLLRGIRHARAQLSDGGTLSVRLKRTQVAPRGCASCTELVEGDYIELVIAESASQLSDDDLLRLFGVSLRQPSGDETRDNLAEIHHLVHAQGGHLIVQRGINAGTALHILFGVGAAIDASPDTGSSISSITRFPLGKH